MAKVSRPHKSNWNQGRLHIDVGKGRNKQHRAVRSPLGAYAIWGTTKSSKKKR